MAQASSVPSRCAKVLAAGEALVPSSGFLTSALRLLQTESGPRSLVVSQARNRRGWGPGPCSRLWKEGVVGEPDNASEVVTHECDHLTGVVMTRQNQANRVKSHPKISCT